MVARILRAAVLVGGVGASIALTADVPAVSFHKDVEPILQKN